MADENLYAVASTRPRWVRRVCTLGALSVIVAILAGCNTSPEDRAKVLGLINQSRSNAGLSQLADNATLDQKADEWAAHLLDICDLEHSRLQDGAPGSWQKLGENVGYGGSVEAVHTAYLNSPGHRANIMDPVYNQVGTAAVWGECNGGQRVFTVQVFMKG